MLLRCRPRILAKAWVFLQQQTCLIHRGNPGQRALLQKTDSSQPRLPDDYRLCLRQHQSRREAFKCSNHKSSTLTFGALLRAQTKTTLFIILILFRNCQPPHLHLPSFTVIFNEEHLRGVEPLLFPPRLLQSPCLLLTAACILMYVSYCGEGMGGCKFWLCSAFDRGTTCPDCQCLTIVFLLRSTVNIGEGRGLEALQILFAKISHKNLARFGNKWVREPDWPQELKISPYSGTLERGVGWERLPGWWGGNSCCSDKTD